MVPYIYILGMSHSGSTLLSFLLNTHPKIVTVGETIRITEIIPDRWVRKVDLCSCGKTYFEDEFWNKVLAGLAARGFGVGEPDFFQFKPSEKEISDWKLKSLIEAILEVSNKTIYLDGSKESVALKPIAENPYLQVKVIDLYRDGRGVLNSWQKRLPNAPLKEMIAEWISREKKRQAALMHLDPTNIIKVKYEDLCSKPQNTLNDIYQFIGVNEKPDNVFAYKSNHQHHIIGNQMRLDDSEGIRLDEKWRETWTSEWEKVFNHQGGAKLNRQLGYLD